MSDSVNYHNLIGRIVEKKLSEHNYEEIILFADGIYHTIYLTATTIVLTKNILVGEIVNVQYYIQLFKPACKYFKFLKNIEILKKPDNLNSEEETAIIKNTVFKNIQKIMNKNPSKVTLFLIRDEIIARLRAQFQSYNYKEVITSTFTKNEDGDILLRRRMNLEHNKLMVLGFSKIFEFGKIFPDETSSKTTNPEMNVLHFTRKNDYKFSKKIVKFILEKIIQSYKQDLLLCGINWNNFIYARGKLSKKNLINPTFLDDITDDVTLGALDEQNTVKRWHLYAGGMLIAEGCQEQNDYDILKESNLPEDYVLAMRLGLDNVISGTIYLDRLIMCIVNYEMSIKELV